MDDVEFASFFTTVITPGWAEVDVAVRTDGEAELAGSIERSQ